MRLQRVMSVSFVAVLTLSACSSGDDTTSDSTTEATQPAATAPVETVATTQPPTTPPPTEPPTTQSVAELAMVYIEAGPNPVGVTTLALANGTKVEVWYPAVAGTSGTETYDIRDFTPDAIKQLLTADVPATYSYAAGRDAKAGDGTHPLVLFSHGFSGVRVQSTFLTAHLASWGFVVAAPDHPSRDLKAATSGAVVQDAQLSVDDLLQTMDLVTAQPAGSILGDHVDAERIIALGHSAGGGTIVGAANQSDKIDGFVSLASGFGRADSPLTVPKQPSFFLAGSTDGVVPPSGTADAFAAATAPSLLWTLDKVGHNGFDDFCTFGNGKGIIGIAEESGLGAFLDVQPQFRALGSDGCSPPSAPVADGFPIIRHAVVAWIRWQTGLDKEPIGLSSDVAGSYALGVTIEAKD